MKFQLLSQISIGIQFLICSLAVWRLTHLFALEDGPGDFVYYLRKKLGNSIFGKAMDCFYCLSIWIALPFAFFLFRDWFSIVVGCLSLSGAACLLEQFTTPGKNNTDNKNTQ
jgi:hypothetical protein